MTSRTKTVKVFRINYEPEGRDRALPIIQGLAERRPVEGRDPWYAAYEVVDASQVFVDCAEELSEIDSCWFEVLDFKLAPRSARG